MVVLIGSGLRCVRIDGFNRSDKFYRWSLFHRIALAYPRMYPDMEVTARRVTAASALNGLML
jgi:hypothetical protein